MTAIPSGCLSPDDIARFFSDRKIDAFCIADCSTITAPAGRHPRDILPSCRTIIIFGVEMRDCFFFGTTKEQSAETRYLLGTLESTAFALRDLLVEAGSASEAILSLPLTIEAGKIRGRLSLKHCAADAGFGTLGENTLLINSTSGNRLMLAAVITEKEIKPSSPVASMPACTHCCRCVAACPAGAICDGVVDLTICRALTDYIPRLIRPLALRLMRGKWSAQLITSVLNQVGPLVAHRVDIQVTCSACMTACPYFHKDKR